MTSILYISSFLYIQQHNPYSYTPLFSKNKTKTRHKPLLKTQKKSDHIFFKLYFSFFFCSMLKYGKKQAFNPQTRLDKIKKH